MGRINKTASLLVLLGSLAFGIAVVAQQGRGANPASNIAANVTNDITVKPAK